MVKQIHGVDVIRKYTHRFRFQDGAFHLIGTTSSSEHDCKINVIDYNLSTGNADLKVTRCDPNGTTGDKEIVVLKERVERKENRLPKMDAFVVGNNTVTHASEEFYY